MSQFNYQNGMLHTEGVSLVEIAKQYGTPCYVYSRKEIESSWSAFDSALVDHLHLVCYAVKANSNIAVLNLLARLGSGFDIVSIGELQRVIKAGGNPSNVVFSGVGKKVDEMQFALEQKIKCFNVESANELIRLNAVAVSMNVSAPVSLRVNPDVDAKTHPYISTGLKDNKFGIAFESAKEVYLQAAAMDNINVVGIDCHIGSQIIELSPFKDALLRVLALIDELKESGIELKHLDIGGGLGITYNDETPPTPAEYVKIITETIQDHDLEIIMEPGRSIVGNAGVLITEVQYLKATPVHNFAIVDAAMNDLIRPALYSGWHDIKRVEEASNAEEVNYDVVGPICETGDFLGKDRLLRLEHGDLLAVCSAGAYGFTMASNYNSRPRVAEIMVDGDEVHEIRKRETVDELMNGESLLPK
ncbi:MAG TPA: diaminopimelate decarboxylase [Thiotrichaceae bacterium]|jgi:diaminopimelate decarboxylase|nr:diaminopimelate decarboxylase [Thiotrichaceae bacterium]HIM08914.1 diaminopimelate decarboxylase [Gammaproteobacteria bacterium]